MTDVVMPQMGESIVEGTLTKWLKKPGDRVERDEPLFEISTDKVDTEIPSPAAGMLAETLVEEGKTVSINTVVARIDEAAATAPTRAGGQPAPCLRSRPRRKPSRPTPAAPAAGRNRRQAGARRAKSPDRSRRWCGAWRGSTTSTWPGPRHRRRRAHHQAGHRGLPGAAEARAAPRRPRAAPRAPRPRLRAAPAPAAGR